MKTTKYFVSVLSLLLLVGCSNNASSDYSISSATSQSSVTSSSVTSQSSVTSASTSEEKVEPKDIDLYKEFYKEPFTINPNYSFDFTLEEFANVSFKVNRRESEQLYDVSKNGEVIFPQFIHQHFVPLISIKMAIVNLWLKEKLAMLL